MVGIAGMVIAVATAAVSSAMGARVVDVREEMIAARRSGRWQWVLVAALLGARRAAAME
jgi:hypothetical protein